MLARVGIVTPWKSADTTNQGHSCYALSEFLTHRIHEHNKIGVSSHPVLESLFYSKEVVTIKGGWLFLWGGRWLTQELLELLGWLANSMKTGSGYKGCPSDNN